MRKNVLIVLATAILTLVMQYLVTHYMLPEKEEVRVKEVRKSGYKMINPVLDYYELEQSLVSETKSMQSKITGYIDKVKSEGKVEMVSVYYRDLNNGPWLGIGEDEHYSPASLLKVPFLIAALKQAEEDPTFLDKKIKYESNIDNNKQNIVDGTQLEVGKEYTIRELLEYMIIHSDNDAKNLLLMNLWKPVFHDVFYDLGIPIENYTDADNFLTVKEYASYFRILYNATYLNKNMSEQALLLLSKTNYNNGIVAGVPSGVVVAHKFGERFFPQQNIKQLHDCGIVYKPGQPYLICVMTRGHDYPVMAKVIADISAIVYNN